MSRDPTASLLASDSGTVSRTSLSVRGQTHVSLTLEGTSCFRVPRLGVIEWVVSSLIFSDLRMVFPSLGSC